MEPLFVLANALDDAFFPSSLNTPQGLADYLARSVEGLSEAELDSLQKALPGIYLIMGDYAFTEPDPDFFVRLAESHGLPVDVAFFRAYAGRDLGTESVQDCVHFGTDLLVNQHGAWVEFRARYPRDYVRFAAEEARNVIEELMGSCACGDSVTVQLELEHFLKRFPRDPIAGDVRGRLASVRKGTSDITFNCPPPHYH